MSNELLKNNTVNLGPIQLSPMDGWRNIELTDEANFHISSVEVFTGDDEGNETDCYTLQRDRIKPQERPALLVSRRVLPEVVKHPMRLRMEPGVRINLIPECIDELSYQVEIAHHKGGIYLRVVQKGMF